MHRRSALPKALQPTLVRVLSSTDAAVPSSSPVALSDSKEAATCHADQHRCTTHTPSAKAEATITVTSSSLVAACTAPLCSAAFRTISNLGNALSQRSACLLTAARWQTEPTSKVSSTGGTARPNPQDELDEGDEASENRAARKRRSKTAAVDVNVDAKGGSELHILDTARSAVKPVKIPEHKVKERAYLEKLRRRAAEEEKGVVDTAKDAEHPWRNTEITADADDGEIGFSDSATELFVLDEEKHDAGDVAELANADRSGDAGSLSPSSAPSPSSTQRTKEGGSPAFAEHGNAAMAIDDTLVDDPFHVPSVDDDALVRDGGAAASSSTAAAAAMTCLGGSHYTSSPGAGANSHQLNEAILSSVDLLCDDLFHCNTEVLRSFARSRRVQMRTKADAVLQLVESAHQAAHGESNDLSVTRKVLGDVFDETVRTSGVRSAWTNKSLEASHIEMACQRHISFELMANSRKTMMVRHNVMEASRVLRKLARLFHEEQEHLSVMAVGGVFRSYRAEADELVRSMPVAELVSPFASFLVSYIRYGSSSTTVTRENVNERLVQLGLFQPTVQEMDDPAILQRLMEMLDPAMRAVELARTVAQPDRRGRAVLGLPEHVVAAARAFSEESHTRWNTRAAPDWVHDLARLFCNWETIVRTDLPRFEDVPRYFFDCILGGVVDHYILQRVYGESVNPTDILSQIRGSLKVALVAHLTNEDNARSALEDLLFYVQGGSLGKKDAVRGDFFAMVLSQMQGAFQDFQEERSALHDERVAVILKCVCDTASHCTRSHSLFSLLVRITEDLQFHLRFQRVYKKLAASDRKTIRLKGSLNMERTLAYFEAEYHITPMSTKAVGFLVVQLLYLALRGDGSKRPVLERLASVTGVAMLDVVGLTETKAVSVRDLHIAFPPQLSYKSWLNESDTREKSVYSVLPSVAVKGTTNQAMIISQAPMMKALDAISRVPWRINKYMLHVQEAIVREGFGFGKIRPGFYPLHYYSFSDGSVRYPSDRRRSAPGFSDADDDGHDGSADDADEVFNIHQRRQMEIQLNADWKELSELRSTRIHYLQALRQARSILQFSHIYFPNSMDFRGRMYPLPGRLNHTGSDPFRGLLEYAEPKPLGSVGLYWLKVHLANKMGMSKLSFDERVHYVDEHLEDVVQSAENPLQGDRWWQEASEPLQCLMACKEVANAMKHSQGPEKYLSRLPVAVDGSYNGLQHYSAIGRDAFGAALVNLIPSERPADAYTGILKEMLKSIHADAARDHQVAQRCLGTGKGQDKDHIKRKTIKRPIMTQVYGVTAFGMSEQIFDELQKQNKSHGLWTHTDMKEMAAYLRDKVLESLGVTFRETQNCRRWISDVVQLIWKVQPPELRNALCWTTPLGLVVRQPYKVHNECSLFTTHGYTRIAGDTTAPASRKQLTAVAPNLIHSLDATHLAMTALEMQHQGLSMMAVHDSYWTYACDLPKLSQVLREQFVSLYSKYDPLWELKEQWEETYFMDLRRHGVKLPDPPKRGDLDLNLVLKSPYFFS